MKKRIQVTINSKLVDDAKVIMAARRFDSFSEFLESLIRAETDRRNFAVPTQVTQQAETKYPPPVARHVEMNETKKKK